MLEVKVNNNVVTFHHSGEMPDRAEYEIRAAFTAILASYGEKLREKGCSQARIKRSIQQILEETGRNAENYVFPCNTY